MFELDHSGCSWTPTSNLWDEYARATKDDDLVPTEIPRMADRRTKQQETVLPAPLPSNIVIENRTPLVWLNARASVNPDDSNNVNSYITSLNQQREREENLKFNLSQRTSTGSSPVRR